MNGVWVALIVAAFGTVIGPLLIAHLNNRQRVAEKQQDWARQDLVAAKVDKAAEQAAEAAELLRQRQEMVAAQAAEAARLLLAANERVAASAAETNGKLDVIHTLVNSNLTAAQQRELAAMMTMLTTMKEVVGLKERLKVTPSPASLEHIRNTQAQVDALSRDLDHKEHQTKVADAKEETSWS
jgi:hypothetical protein